MVVLKANASQTTTRQRPHIYTHVYAVKTKRSRLFTAWFLQKYVWKGELNAGSYYLLPFTSGCKLKRRNKKNMSGKSVQLINRTDTDEIDLSRELRSVWKYAQCCPFSQLPKIYLACCSCGRREALSDIFDIIDLDGNGLLSLEEYNFFELRTSGEKCDKDAWLVCKGHHFSMTYTGCVYFCRCVWRNDQE